MYSKLNQFTLQWIQNKSPWTNVYGIARTLLAFSTLMTLLLNDVSTFFRPVSGLPEYPSCAVYPISIFCLGPTDLVSLNIVKWIVIALLLLIMSGWRPRITGIIHWWIASSIQNTATTIDGGEQVAVVLTFLLIPVTLLDNRRWHWTKSTPPEESHIRIHSKIIAVMFLGAIKIQMCIIYFNAAIAKIKNPEWVDGTAVYYYMNDPMLGLNGFLKWISDPILNSALVVIPTWGTIVIELILGAGIIAKQKFNIYLLILGIILHLIFAVFIGLYSFSLIMCAGLLIAFKEKPIEFNFIKQILYRKQRVHPELQTLHSVDH